MRIIFYTFFILCSTVLFSQTTLTVYRANKYKSEVNYKRGPAAPGMNGCKNAQQTRGFLEMQDSFGMTIHNEIQNLYKDLEINEFYQANGGFKN